MLLLLLLMLLLLMLLLLLLMQTGKCLNINLKCESSNEKRLKLNFFYKVLSNLSSYRSDDNDGDDDDSLECSGFECEHQLWEACTVVTQPSLVGYGVPGLAWICDQRPAAAVQPFPESF